MTINKLTLLDSEFVSSDGYKLITLPGASEHIVKEVEKYNKMVWEREFPGLRYEDRIPEDACITILLVESRLIVMNNGESPASNIQLIYKDEILMDQDEVLKNLTLDPGKRVMLKMDVKMEKGDEIQVKWEEFEESVNVEIH